MTFPPRSAGSQVPCSRYRCGFGYLLFFLATAVSCGLYDDSTAVTGTDWPAYGNDPGGMRYSPLAQVHTGNVTQLQVAWKYNTAEAYEIPAQSTLQLPEGAGKAIMERMCMSCHSVETVTGVRYSRQRWGQVVENMLAFGAQGTPADVEAVIDYLARNYGLEEEHSPAEADAFGPGRRRRGAAARRSQVTPLVVDGVMYLTTPFNRVVALTPQSGEEIWRYEIPEDLGRPAIRGLAYRPGEGEAPPSLYFGTTNGYLVALEADSGRPAAGFARQGVLDLKVDMTERFPGASYGMTSPPTVYKHLVITGSRVQESPSLGPPGDVRAWDARSGELIWRFHTVPRPGQTGHETWEDDSWKDRSGANVWGIMTVDAERGIVYLPLGCATYDYWGGDRKGANLFGTTLVALDAETGELKWHFQVTHHDVWDYDLAAPPVLFDVVKNGRTIPAVAQITKQGLLFILDRTTGEPIHGVEERPVPQDGFVAGEHPWPTQPFPVKPEPLARTSFGPEEIARVTPEHERHCRQLLEEHPDLRTGGLYLPFGESPSLIFPGTLGGNNWHGASFDPRLGYLFTNTQNLGEFYQIVLEEDQDPRAQRWKFWDAEKYWPCHEPPWGELAAVNVNTGDVVWRVPLGEFEELTALGVPRTGTPNMGGAIATAGGLVFVGGTVDGRFRAFDSHNGQELWAVDLGAASRAVPITFLGRDGKQYVAVMVSGGGFLQDPVIPATLVVFSLP